MDSDATTLQNAVDVLRRHYGEQLAGPQVGTETQMRNALQQQLGLDPLGADRVLKQLRDTNRLVYVGSEEDEAGTEDGTGTDREDIPDARGTGPVISMPLTQSADGGRPLITTASPAMLMGITNDQSGDAAPATENPGGDTLGWLVAPAVGEGPTPATTGDNPDQADDHTQGYWRIG